MAKRDAPRVVLNNVSVWRVSDRPVTVFVEATGARIDGPAEITDADTVFDCTGTILVPSLADIHVHTYQGATFWGIPIEAVSLASGVTHVVDAGSAGADNFRGLEVEIRNLRNVSARALVNVSTVGLTSQVDEFSSVRNIDPARTIECVERHAGLVAGIKVRLNSQTVAGHADAAMAAAREIADAVKLPLMVDIEDPPPGLSEVLEHMTPGDILTHCYVPAGNRLNLDDTHLAAARDAVSRGILLDVGHGASSFAFDVAENLVAEGLIADIVSSDLHVNSLCGPVFNLLTVMSKLMCVGMPLDVVLQAATLTPRAALDLEPVNWPSDLGSDLCLIKVGSECEFEDVKGDRRSGPLLECLLTVRGGRAVFRSPRLPRLASW